MTKQKTWIRKTIKIKTASEIYRFSLLNNASIVINTATRYNIINNAIGIPVRKVKITIKAISHPEARSHDKTLSVINETIE